MRATGRSNASGRGRGRIPQKGDVHSGKKNWGGILKTGKTRKGRTGQGKGGEGRQHQYGLTATYLSRNDCKKGGTLTRNIVKDKKYKEIKARGGGSRKRVM